MWIMGKIKNLYYRESLTNKNYLKNKLFGFKMYESKILDNSLDEFKKVIVELGNIDKEIAEEIQVVVLLNSLLEYFDVIRVAIEYRLEDLTLDVMVSTLR